jgi:hypothetical protein
VQVFKYIWFARFTRKENIKDSELQDIVSFIEIKEAEYEEKISK